MYRISLIIMGISLTASIVDSVKHTPLVLMGFGIFLLALSAAKKKWANILKIASSAAFVIGIVLGAFFWGAYYIKIFLIFVGCMLVYIVIAKKIHSRKS